MCRKDFIKPPLTFAEQLELLKSRGLIVTNQTKALNYLSRIGYYRLRPYAIEFQINSYTDQYRSDVYIEQIIGLYNFDRSLRSVFSEAIESFEISLRTHFANYLSCKNKDPFVYLNKDEFRLNSVDRQNNYNKLLEKISDNCKNSQELFIAHFKETYWDKTSSLHPPIWMITEILTLGQLSKIIYLLNSSNQKKLANIYGMDRDSFLSFLKVITTVRNLSAHHARLWNRRFTSVINSNIFNDSELTEALNRKERNKIYNIILVLFHALSKVNAPSKILQQVKTLINKYNIDTHKMGFPDNWKEITYWK